MKRHRHLMACAGRRASSTPTLARFASLASALGLTLSTGAANASSHREAPAIAADPTADNTDVYAWVDNNGNLVVVAAYNGLELPEGAPNWQKFSDDVLYEIHIARGPTSLADAITYQFKFTTTPYPRIAVNGSSLPAPGAGKGQEFFAQLSGGGAFSQTYSVTKIVNGQATVIGTGLKVPPPNVGPTTDAVVNGITGTNTYEGKFVDTAATTTIGTLSNGEGRVFAGPRDDPFYVDLGAVFDLAQVRPVLGLEGGKSLGGTGAKVCTNCTARNSTAYTNVHAIELEIPGMVANGGTAVTSGISAAQTVGVWASASRRKVTVLRRYGKDDHAGPWQRVSRLGIPLINETVIGLQDKDYWNRTSPADDAPIFGAYFDNLVAARDAQAVGYYDGPLSVCKIENGGPPFTNRLADIVPVINLPDHTGANAITSVGDVLRVDLGQKMQDFPNGRRLVAGSNVESVDVVDTEIKMLFCTLTNATVNANSLLKPGALAPNTPYGGIPDGVNANEASFKATFPYLAPPWQGFSASPHGAPAD
jgi:hypothetical protein